MNIKTLTVIPSSLRQLPQPVARLYECGASLEELLGKPRVAIVGSRKPTVYGKQVTLRLGRELAAQGIVVISGLALGIDALAHEGALEARGVVLAVLPGPLDNIVPSANRRLAGRILRSGGTLLSEYPSGMPIDKYMFIARNRLIAALAQAVIITEAGATSGSLHTAAFAQEQGIPVMAVPGTIISSASVGTNNLLRQGAALVTSSQDVLDAIGITGSRGTSPVPRSENPHEQLILDLLGEGITEGEHLLAGSRLVVSEFNKALAMLEIKGHIRPLGANRWSL